MRYRVFGGLLFAALAMNQVAWAQFGKLKGTLDKATQVANKFKDVELTEPEEIKLGENISARVRAKYGVVQDPAIHKYVTLVGTVIVKKSSRSSLPYHFIVLDTDGVNAFAAPGGYVHITRGALALMKNEADLAGVLGHEIAHVTEKHAINAIRNGKLVQMGVNETSVSSNPELFRRLEEEIFKIVMAGYGQKDELDSDEHGVIFSANTGYEAEGLGEFLNLLKSRNTSSDSKQGLFASHPETDERLKKLDALIKSRNLSGGEVLQARYAANVKYQPVDQVKIAAIAEGTSGVAGGGDKKDEEKKEGGDEGKKKSRFSLSRLSNPTATSGDSKQSAAVTGSGGSRGVDREREAKGGSNPALVAVTLTDKDLDDFKKEGKLKT
jgi:predicted Zn-dependent protease